MVLVSFELFLALMSMSKISFNFKQKFASQKETCVQNIICKRDPVYVRK